MGNPWAGTGMDRNTVVEGFLDQWREFRRTAPSREEGDRRCRAFLMGEVAAAATASDHAFVLFELAVGLAERELLADAFLVFSWLAEEYVGDRDEELAWRVIMGLTDDCVMVALHYRTEWCNAAARRLLRTILDRVGPPGRVRIDRAAVRALVQLAHLRGEAEAPAEAKAAELAELWTEVAERWHPSADPEVRERTAQGLVNRAFVALQDGDDTSPST